MKRLFTLLAATLLLAAPLSAQQRYTTRSASIDFFSDAPLEDISAKNTQVTAAIDLLSQQMAFVATMKEFVFPDGLMQAHFNENFVESEKYPRATFSGRLLGIPESGMPTAGIVPVEVEGDLTIHGVKRRVKVPGTLEFIDKQLVAKAKFSVAPADYKIDIPSLIKEHIAKTVDITVYAVCAPQIAPPVSQQQATPPARP
ncbi:YceI family protein [Hymenobacter jeollabukensis]|uniref:YceI family protein n=1 Tax=Hymenobacter jeollabukensis TaxID=2025313 RepID=A0A5R8WNC3_9BACT|nr:YceI family protein [Hymenobacter jeollabukensis]TLM90599.1 YceI family protein [Hymenobacter jeollabukensis]